MDSNSEALLLAFWLLPSRQLGPLCGGIQNTCSHMTSFTRDTPIIRGTLVITVKHKCFSGLVEQRERALVCLLKFGFKRLNQIRGFVSSVRRLKVINESHVRVYETPLRSYTLL